MEKNDKPATPRTRTVGAPVDDPRRALRVPGKGKGRLHMLHGFDDPLPPQVLVTFEGDDE